MALNSGVELQRYTVGVGSGLPERGIASSDVHIHVIDCSSSPATFDSIFNFAQLLNAAAHCTQGASTDNAGAAQLKALSQLLPETTSVLDDVLQRDQARYRITSAASAPGVLCHHLQVYWNIEGIEKRYGKEQRDLFRDRAAYTVDLEEAVGDASVPSSRIVFKIVETLSHRMDFTFCTVESGSLVWMSTDGTPILQEGGVAAVAPGLVGSSLRWRLSDGKLPLTGCGCLIRQVGLPNMVFSMDVARNPHVVLSLRCLEMGAFPLEWFWRPLFNGAHMRLLFVRYFREEMHFMGNEFHTRVSFQIPRLGSMCKRILKSFSTMLVGAIFSPPDKDPLPVFLNALGRDLAALEASMKAKGPPSC
jgi:hypothetical protein